MIAFLRNYYLSFFQADADRDEIRRLAVLILLSLIGILMTGLYGLYWIIHDEWILAIIDFGGMLTLAGNLILVKRLGRYQLNILFAVIVLSFLVILLYWNGTNAKPTFVWYYVFPGVAAFLLGSRRGVILTLLVIIPVFFAVFELHPFFSREAYTLGVLLRFLSSYFIVGLVAYLFEVAAERNRGDLDALNRSLENTVQDRTAELLNKNTLLADEIKERQAAEEQLTISLQEKEVLLKEVYHRTKNNMNVIISLLNLQRLHITPENVDGVFAQLGQRIRSMSAVHERLYQSDNVATISLGDYVRDLAHQLRSAFVNRTEEVEIDCQSDRVEIGLNQAVPLGLALNEIITNSYKHAHREGTLLILRIQISEEPMGRVQLKLGDNGPGLPPDFDPSKTATLGTHLIKILLQDQLAATVAINQGEGWHYVISFDREEIQLLPRS